MRNRNKHLIITGIIIALLSCTVVYSVNNGAKDKKRKIEINETMTQLQEGDSILADYDLYSTTTIEKIIKFEKIYDSSPEYVQKAIDNEIKNNGPFSNYKELLYKTNESIEKAAIAFTKKYTQKK